jgi:Na+/melibiose symporter-like transporter
MAFACGYIPYAALYLSAVVQLPRFFATSLGLGASAGAVFFLVRLVDIPVDPALGVLMDRTRTQLGRYRPWLAAGAPVLVVALAMIYQARPGAGHLYLGAGLFILYLGMSFLLVGGNAWAAALAPAYRQRSRLFGVQSALGVIGSASALAIPIFAETRHLTEAEGVRMVGRFLMALAPLCVLIALVGAPEPAGPQAGRARLRMADYAALLARPNVLRLLAADFAVTLGPGWMSALYLYFSEDSRKFSVSQANVLLAIYILAGFAGAPAAAWLANRIGKHRALMAATTGYSLMLVLIVLLPKGLFAPMAPAMFTAGALAAGFVVLIRAMAADIGDEIRLETQANLAGLLYALASATTKAALALGAGLTFWVLGLAGYDFRPGAHNGGRQLLALDLTFLAGPIVFMMIAGACFLGYQLTADRHAEIRRALALRDGPA